MKRVVDHTGRLRAGEWMIREVSQKIAAELVEREHYSGGAPNTAVYRHGLFPAGALFDRQCVGVAMWLPPIVPAAKSVYPSRPGGVLALSRLAIAPAVPKNAASFLLGGSMRMIDRERWPCLLTYADELLGHVGAIYRATNWEYLGLTKPETSYAIGGRSVSRKAGKRTRTAAEMIALGAVVVGRGRKHKFRHIEKTKGPGR